MNVEMTGSSVWEISSDGRRITNALKIGDKYYDIEIDFSEGDRDHYSHQVPHIQAIWKRFVETAEEHSSLPSDDWAMEARFDSAGQESSVILCTSNKSEKLFVDYQFNSEDIKIDLGEAHTFVEKYRDEISVHEILDCLFQKIYKVQYRAATIDWMPYTSTRTESPLNSIIPTEPSEYSEDEESSSDAASTAPSERSEDKNPSLDGASTASTASSERLSVLGDKDSSGASSPPSISSTDSSVPINRNLVGTPMQKVGASRLSSSLSTDSSVPIDRNVEKLMREVIKCLEAAGNLSNSG